MGTNKKGLLKRICCTAMGLMLSLSLFAGCTKSSNQENDSSLILGFSQIGSESAWRIGNTKDIEDQAQNYGVNLMFENANQKQENQIAAIRRFIAYKVDVIAFSPIVEEGWDNVLTEAKDAGIPVILVDRDISTQKEGLTTCLIGADFYNEGVMAGEYLIRNRRQCFRERSFFYHLLSHPQTPPDAVSSVLNFPYP